MMAYEEFVKEFCFYDENSGFSKTTIEALNRLNYASYTLGHTDCLLSLKEQPSPYCKCGNWLGSEREKRNKICNECV